MPDSSTSVKDCGAPGPRVESAEDKLLSIALGAMLDSVGFKTTVDNSFTLTDKHGIEADFDSSGYLASVEDRNGNTVTVKCASMDGSNVMLVYYVILVPKGRVARADHKGGDQRITE